MKQEIIVNQEEYQDDNGSDAESEYEEGSSIEGDSDVESEEEAESSDLDDIFAEIGRQREITFNEIKMFEFFPVEGGAFLKCTACSHQIPLSKTFVEGNQIPYMELEYHMRLVHRLRSKKTN